MKPDISIIVPVYNVEKQLKLCIESILNQSFTNYELILIDDGSTDGCAVICDDYSKMDKRIKVIHKKNGGLSDARNVGLDISVGKYIGFIDSDDIIHPKMYEKLYNCINKTCSDIVQCKFKKFKNIEEISNTENYNDIYYEEFSNEDAIRDLIDNNKINVNAWNKLYRRELFKNERYPKGKVHEDEFLTYKLIYKSQKIVYINCELYYYYQNNSGIMNGSNIVKRLDRIEALEERNKYFLKRENMNLYSKSNAALFFSLNKLYFVFRREKGFKYKNYYTSLLKDKIKRVASDIGNNSYLSNGNRIVIKLINKNKLFINIYYFQNLILSVCYKIRNIKRCMKIVINYGGNR